MKIAYLVNQYPKVSHSFIRREILALERQGVDVARFAVRGWDAEVTDPDDRSELDKTQYLLQGGLGPLLLAFVAQFLRAPRLLCGALVWAWRLSRRADRPFVLHLVYLLEACHLYRKLRLANCSHVHAHFGTNSAEVALLASLLGNTTFSFTVHGPEEFDKPEAIKLREKTGLASFVVAISSFGRSQLFRWIDSSLWRKVQVVHCGLERGFFEGSLTPPPDVARLVCVGRLCEQKGQLLLIQAMQVLKSRGVSLELVLAGDGEMRPEVEAEIARHGLQSSVRITGWISSAQVREEILAARALVLPSFAEGLPVVIMEAMALQRPVLTTSIAGIPELVKSGETGWLFPAGDVDTLADAMQSCLELPVEELRKMGQVAHNIVVQRHSIDTEAAKLRTLFEGVVPQAVSP
jgi:colanic acid/amylovoran biosynthesis glycosyltransferase